MRRAEHEHGIKCVAVHIEKSLIVWCDVLDSRSMWGRVDYLVSPVSGEGQQWIDSTRVDRSKTTDLNRPRSGQCVPQRRYTDLNR